MGKHDFIPEIGDRVGVLKREGTFIVTAVDGISRSVDVRLAFSEYRLDQVPWDELISLKKMSREDVDQIATRIVREAAKGS